MSGDMGGLIFDDGLTPQTGKLALIANYLAP